MAFKYNTLKCFARFYSKKDICGPVDSSGNNLTNKKLEYIKSNCYSHVENRMAFIAKPSRITMQDSSENTKKWTLSYETQEKWENPLMGWVSTADPISDLTITFDTLSQAISYCDKYGISYSIRKPSYIAQSFPTYAEKFSWSSPTRSSTK